MMPMCKSPMHFDAEQNAIRERHINLLRMRDIQLNDLNGECYAANRTGLDMQTIAASMWKLYFSMANTFADGIWWVSALDLYPEVESTTVSDVPVPSNETKISDDKFAEFNQTTNAIHAQMEAGYANAMIEYEKVKKEVAYWTPIWDRECNQQQSYWTQKLIEKATSDLHHYIYAVRMSSLPGGWLFWGQGECLEQRRRLQKFNMKKLRILLEIYEEMSDNVTVCQLSLL